MRKKVTKKNVETWVDKYVNKKWSIRTLSKVYLRNPQVLRNHLKRRGVVLRGSNSRVTKQERERLVHLFLDKGLNPEKMSTSRNPNTIYRVLCEELREKILV